MELKPGDGEATEAIRWKAIAVEVLLLVILVFGFYAPLWRADGLPSGADTTSMLWPLRAFTLASYQHFGEVPLWNSFHFMGTPFAATLQHGVFHPPTLIFLFLTQSATWAIKLEALYGLLMGALGAWYTARFALRTGTAGALLAGAIFALQTRMQYAPDNVVILSSTALIPWCLGLVVQLGLGRMAPLRFATLWSAAAAVQFLAGHPQFFLYTRMAEGCVLLGCMLLKTGTLKQRIRPLVILAAAGTLSLLLVAIQLLPALELSPRAYRQVYALQEGYALQGCFTPGALLHLVTPQLYNEAGVNNSARHSEVLLYMGLLPLIWAGVWGGVMLRHRQYRIAALWLAALGICLMMMLSGNLSVGRLWNDEFTDFPKGSFVDAEAAEVPRAMYLSPLEALTVVFPPLQGMRVPARFAVFLNLLLILTAASGMKRVLTLEKFRGWTCSTLGTLTIVMAIAELAWLSHNAPFRNLVIPSQEADEETVAEQLVRENPTRVFRLSREDDVRVQASIDAEWLTRQRSLEQRMLFHQENLNVLTGRFSVDGYEEGLAPLTRTKEFILYFNRHLRTPEPDPILLQLLGVERYLTSLPLSPNSIKEIVSNTAINGEAIVTKDARMAYWESEFSGIDWRAIDAPSTYGGYYIAGRAKSLIPYGQAPAFHAAPSPPSFRWISPNRFQVLWNQLNSETLLVSLPPFPGWVTEEGNLLIPRNAVISEVPISTATANSSVTVVYKPKSYQLGMILSLVAVMLWSILAVISVPRFRKATP
jgi:hypothetical protein